MTVSLRSIMQQNLADWISPHWMEHYRSGTLASCYSTDPYEYFCLPNLLKEEVFHDLCQRISDLEVTHEEFSRENAKEYEVGSGRIFSTLRDPTALYFFLGKEFRHFLRVLTGNSLVLAPKEVPQLRTYPGISPGLKIHNDVTSPFEFGTLFYLNKNWRNDWGGELKMWTLDREARKFLECKAIQPIGNTLFGIRCSRNSWHSVGAMSSPTPRKNIFIQFKIKD